MADAVTAHRPRPGEPEPYVITAREQKREGTWHVFTPDPSYTGWSERVLFQQGHAVIYELALARRFEREYHYRIDPPLPPVEGDNPAPAVRADRVIGEEDPLDQRGPLEQAQDAGPLTDLGGIVRQPATEGAKDERIRQLEAENGEALELIAKLSERLAALEARAPEAPAPAAAPPAEPPAAATGGDA